MRAEKIPEIRREMNHARLSGVPNGVALNHSGQAGTERVHQLRRRNRFRRNRKISYARASPMEQIPR